MNAPDIIKLTDEEAAGLRTIEETRAANAAFAEQVRTAGERRNLALVEKSREIWVALAKKYNLDLERVNYGLTADGSALKVRAVQFE